MSPAKVLSLPFASPTLPYRARSIKKTFHLHETSFVAPRTPTLTEHPLSKTPQSPNGVFFLGCLFKCLTPHRLIGQPHAPTVWGCVGRDTSVTHCPLALQHHASVPFWPDRCPMTGAKLGSMPSLIQRRLCHTSRSKHTVGAKINI